MSVLNCILSYAYPQSVNQGSILGVVIYTLLKGKKFFSCREHKRTCRILQIDGKFCFLERLRRVRQESDGGIVRRDGTPRAVAISSVRGVKECDKRAVSAYEFRTGTFCQHGVPVKPTFSPRVSAIISTAAVADGGAIACGSGRASAAAAVVRDAGRSLAWSEWWVSRRARFCRILGRR